jgi:hypothetical protein
MEILSEKHQPNIFNLVGVDSPPLCGEEDKLQSEALGSAADPIPYPVCLQRGSLICIKRCSSAIKAYSFAGSTTIKKRQNRQSHQIMMLSLAAARYCHGISCPYCLNTTNISIDLIRH